MDGTGHGGFETCGSSFGVLASLDGCKWEWNKEARWLWSAKSIKNIRTYNDDDYLPIKFSVRPPVA